MFWFYCRVAVLVVNVWGIVAMDERESNVEWWAAFVVAGLMGGAVWMWLYFERWMNPRVFTGRWFLCSRFWWPNQYPFEFWFFMGVCLAVCGSVRVAVDVFRFGMVMPLAGTFFLMGVVMVLCVVGVVRMRGRVR